MNGSLIERLGRGGKEIAGRYGLLVLGVMVSGMVGATVRHDDWSGRLETLLLTVVGIACFVLLIEIFRHLDRRHR